MPVEQSRIWPWIVGAPATHIRRGASRARERLRCATHSRVASAILSVFVWLPGLIELQAATLSGSLAEDEVWTGTVQLTGDVVVPSGVTLTIEPGTQVLLPASADDQSGGQYTDRTEVIVNGSLIAVGVLGNEIVVTSNAGLPSPGDWGSIRAVWNVVGGTLQVAHMVLEYGTHGIDWQAQAGIHSGAISNCLVRGMLSRGLSVACSGGSQLSVDMPMNEVVGNGQDGIFASVSGTGSRLDGSFVGNVVVSNQGHGLYLLCQSGVQTDLSVSGNVFEVNADSGFYVYGQNTGASTVHCDVRNNRTSGNSVGLHGYAWIGNMALRLEDNESFSNQVGVICRSYSRSGTYDYHAVLENNREVVYGNTEQGIFCKADFRYVRYGVALRGNEVFGNGGHGIECWRHGSSARMQPVFIRNRVYQNGGDGIHCQAVEPALAIYNEIQDNVGVAMFMELDQPSRVHMNALGLNAGPYVIHNQANAPIDASMNDWGAAVTAEMDAGGNPKNVAGIFDGYDDPTVGTVRYTPWLATPPIGSAGSRISSHHTRRWTDDQWGRAHHHRGSGGSGRPPTGGG